MPTQSTHRKPMTDSNRTAAKTAAFHEIRQSSLNAETVKRPDDYQVPTADPDLLERCKSADPGVRSAARRELRQWHQRF